MKPKISFRDFDPEWSRLFERERVILLGLGDPWISSVNHIGSTSIPGCRAKPIIDIAIEIYEYPPKQAFVEKLELEDYENMGEASFESRYWFRKGNPRTYHVHLVENGSDILSKIIQFKDILSDSPKLVKEYIQLKENMAKGMDLDSCEYAMSKTNLSDRFY